MKARIFALALVVALAPADEARAQQSEPRPQSFLAWMGLASGDRVAYATVPDGERVCVEVGSPVTIGGARYAELRFLPWPGLATDSAVYVPLDGRYGLATIRTPTLRPAQALDWLLPPITPGLVDAREEDGAAGEGWRVVAGDPDRPAELVYVWCALCSDAGTTVRIVRGRGITSVTQRTFTGIQRIARVDDGCEPRPSEPERAELEVYVAPAPERDP
jgi:hypothetical protein